MSNFLEALSGTLSLAAVLGGVFFIILPAFGGIAGSVCP
jgi:hypothetical protein